jgi:DNA-binding CsgD family transcriptional regulator
MNDETNDESLERAETASPGSEADRLTDNEIRTIRTLCRSQPAAKVAQRFGVAASTVNRIVSRSVRDEI